MLETDATDRAIRDWSGSLMRKRCSSPRMCALPARC